MCFCVLQKNPIVKMQKRFNAVVDHPEIFLQAEQINGFDFPYIPIILNKSPEIININHTWGLLPN